MYLSAPSFTFSIYSVHDRTQLDCRLYLPSNLRSQCSAVQPLRGAIIAHPYAPLGGCYDDPVVGFLGGELLEAGYIVGTFNFRGATDAYGKTSWTGRPELADYVSFYGFMFLYLHILKSGMPKSRRISDSEDSGQTSGQRSTDVHITLGGYSYGSLIASNLPTLDSIVDLFNDGANGAPFDNIIQTAQDISQLSKGGGAAIPQRPKPSPGHSFPEDFKGLFDPTMTTISFLLISPLLPPINLFLTMFSKLWLDVGDHGSRKGRQIACPKQADQLSAHPTLVIYGNRDTFTSAHKLQKWSEDLMHLPGSRFRSVAVDGAGHFWRETGVESQARKALRTWLDQIV